MNESLPIDSLETDEPIFTLYVNNIHVASLFEPQYEDMFWYSYQLISTNPDDDRIIYERKTWQMLKFIIKDKQGFEPNPYTISGAYEDFCERKTDRLSFRSLCPPSQPQKFSFSNWLQEKLSPLFELRN